MPSTPAVGGFGLDGLVALVTGGASGIGAATVTLLRERGAVVAVMDVAASAEEGVLSLEADVSDDAAVREAVASTAERHGRLDIVVNNVGIGSQGNIESHGDDEWLRLFDINVVGAVRVSRAALPHLRRSPHASIVNTSSVAATGGLANHVVYSATKGALLSLTLAMAADHVLEGIRVNCVAPGNTETPRATKMIEESDDPGAVRALLDGRQPIGRMLTPREIAEGIVYLASPASSGTTGTVLPVDGGITALRAGDYGAGSWSGTAGL